MKRNIDLLKAMRSFITVVEQKSFSAASEILNLATSAVSRQVTDLEKHFDCQLLYRTTRSMHLTAEGQFYLEQFKEILGQLESLESKAYERQQKVAGHLRITTPLNANQLGFQELISNFSQEFPDVKLSWTLLNRYVNLVEEGIDLAIRVGPLEDSSMIARHLGDLGVRFVASPEYLEKNGMPLHPKNLQNHHCLIDSSTVQPSRWAYMDGAHERHITVSGSIDINSGSLIAEFAARGHGIAQLPNFLISDYLEQGQLVSILEPYQLAPKPVSLVYPANRSVNPALRALVQYFLDNKPRLN